MPQVDDEILRSGDNFYIKKSIQHRDLRLLMGDRMSSQTKKERPAGVPEENVYDKMHWTVIVALVAVVVTIYFAVNHAT